jgi:DnaJ-class molecular chaperone
MNPNYDILGLDAGASKEMIDAAYRRLETTFDRNNMLDSPEFADIESAYKTLPESENDIDRKIWEWATWKDSEGEWNTLVRKIHRLNRKAEASKSWTKESSGGKSKKDKRANNRDKRFSNSGYGDD